MGDDKSLIMQGIDAARAGNRRLARDLLSRAVRDMPDSVTAWLWLSSVMDTPQGRAFCLERVLALDPGNAAARRGLAALAGAGHAPVLVARAGPEDTSAPAPPPDTGPARQGPFVATDTKDSIAGRLARLGRSGPGRSGRSLRGAVPGARAETGPGRAGEQAATGRLARLRSSVALLISRIRLFSRRRERRPGRRWRLAPPGRRARATAPGGQARFWQVVVGCLAAIALALVGLLVYSSSAAHDQPAASRANAMLAPPGEHILVANARPRATLRPTFTPIATRTPLPTATDFAAAFLASGTEPEPTPTPTVFLPPMLATFTPTPEPTVARARAKVPPTATAVPKQPPLPPRAWDPRLDALHVRFEPAAAVAGQGYWRLIEARWADGFESGGKHAIYVEVQNKAGARAVGVPVIFEWASGSEALATQDRPPPDWGVNFPMYNTLGSYSARIAGGPSDKVIGMGMGTADAPDFTIHTCFYLTFRWIQP